MSWDVKEIEFKTVETGKINKMFQTPIYTNVPTGKFVWKHVEAVYDKELYKYIKTKIDRREARNLEVIDNEVSVPRRMNKMTKQTKEEKEGLKRLAKARDEVMGWLQ